MLGPSPTSWGGWPTETCPSWPRTPWELILEQIFLNNSDWQSSYDMFWHFWTATYIMGMLEDTKVSILTPNYMGIDSGANNWNESGWVPFDNMPEGIFGVTYFMGKVTVPNVSILKSQMCPSWPRKKGPGRTRHLVRALSKCPRSISIPWNRFLCWPTGTKSYTGVQTGWGQVGHVLIVSKALCPGERPETLSWHPF